MIGSLNSTLPNGPLEPKPMSVPMKKEMNINGFKLFTPTEDVSYCLLDS